MTSRSFNAIRAALFRALAMVIAPLALALTGVPASAQPAGNAAAAEYLLGPGDVVRISTYQDLDLTLETRLTEAGVVNYPLLGNVRIGGLSVTASEKLIADGLRSGSFVRQPQVSIVVQQVRGNQASVLGQVNRPGRFPIETADMRLSDMLGLAGGATAGGADTVVVTAKRGGKRFRGEVDMPSLFGADDKDNDRSIQNGDGVWVDRQPLVYLYGEVQRPGPMRLERSMTMMQMLATGGGLTVRGTEKGVRVHRKAANGKVQVITPTLDDKLQDSDVVYVRESLF